MSKFTVIALLFGSQVFTSLCYAYTDRELSDTWCRLNTGIIQAEVEGLRVDCLLPDKAVEVEILDKQSRVYESIGQALTYGAFTGRQSAIVYKISSKEHAKYVARLKYVIAEKKLDIELIDYDKDISQLAEASSTEQQFSQPAIPKICSKICSEGKARGDSCIRKTYTCRKTVTTACNRDQM